MVCQALVGLGSSWSNPWVIYATQVSSHICVKQGACLSASCTKFIRKNISGLWGSRVRELQKKYGVLQAVVAPLLCFSPLPVSLLTQVERNLVDAMGVARNICMDPRLVPGGGACEMAVSSGLAQRGEAVEGVEQGPYKAVGASMEVIPRCAAWPGDLSVHAMHPCFSSITYSR